MKSWQYLLHHKTTDKYIYLDDATNSIVYSDDPVALTYTPDGWQKKSIAWERDTNKFGLVRSFTVNLNFVMDGKTLIDKIALQQSFETPVELIIQKLNLNATSNPAVFEYVDFYIGELELPSLESDEIKVTLPISEGGLMKQLKANETTEYEFEPDEINLYHDGIKLSMKQNWLITEGTQIESFGNGVHMIGCVKTTTDGQAAGFASFDVFFDKNEVADFDNDLRYLFTTTQAITGLRVTATINIHTFFSHNYTVTIKSNLGQTFYPIDNVALTSNTDYTFDIDLTIDSAANEKWFLFGQFGTGGPSDSMTYTEGEFHVEFSSRYRATYIKGLTAWELYQRLIEKITGDRDNADSTLLESLQNIVISCGDALRGISGAKIKTSLADFFKFCKVVMVAGMGVENEKVVIEELSHFCDTSDPIELGECRSFKWKFADDFFFNTIKIGWENKTSDEVNGKYSFNATHNYSTPLTSVSKPLDLITGYVADPFYQENKRINLDGQDTTDNNADSEIMVFNTEQNTTSLTATHILFDISTADGSYLFIEGLDDQIDKFVTFFTISGTTSNDGNFTVKRKEAVTGGGINVFVNETVTTELAASVGIEIKINSLLRETYVNTDTGVPDIETLYNIIYLTPKRIFKRWKPYFNSCLFQFPGMDITFETTEKNRKLKTENSLGEIYDEDSDEVVGGEKLFKAIYYNFETIVDDVVPETLNSNPNKGFQTTNPVNNKNFKGVLMKGAMAANELTAQSFKLLADKDDDEGNLLVTNKVIIP